MHPTLPIATYIGVVVGIIIALLLMIIIVLMVIGFIRRHRRKNVNSWDIPNNATFPNPMYGGYNQSSKPSSCDTPLLNQQNQYPTSTMIIGHNFILLFC